MPNAEYAGVQTLSSTLGVSNASGMLTPWKHAGFHVVAERRGALGAPRGGDFYTLAVRSPGHIGVVIGDACGRGAEAEEQLWKILPKIHELALSQAGPAELLTELNRTVAAALPADRFVTAAAFELDLHAGVLVAANAAHVPAIVRRSGSRRVLVVGPASGMPLGIARDTVYSDECHMLREGDVIVLMTDGLLEAIESDLLQMSTLMRYLAASDDGARDVHEFLLRKFEERTRGERADDMTLVAIEATAEPISGRFFDLACAS